MIFCGGSGVACLIVWCTTQHDILDMNEIFRDLATMVHEQGDQIGELPFLPGSMHVMAPLLLSCIQSTLQSMWKVLQLTYNRATSSLVTLHNIRYVVLEFVFTAPPLCNLSLPKSYDGMLSTLCKMEFGSTCGVDCDSMCEHRRDLSTGKGGAKGCGQEWVTPPMPVHVHAQAKAPL